MAPVAQTLGETTGSVSALQQLKTWIEDCNANHPRCKPVSATGNDDQETGDNPTSTGSSRDPAPRRLIKVGRDDEKPYVVDLTEPPYYGKVPRYSTLSWCWGDSTMKMKTEDVPQFMDPAHGIPDLSVQKTFKHAIDVTRSLGIGYIWIDALCIIQEGPDADFHAEGVKMDRCYRNSAVTIAAAASTSGSGGLFYPVNGRMRDLSDLIPNTFTTSEHCKLPSAGPWSVLAADMWEDQLLRSSHLYTRGWVVQGEHDDYCTNDPALTFGQSGCFLRVLYTLRRSNCSGIVRLLPLARPFLPDCRHCWILRQRPAVTGVGVCSTAPNCLSKMKTTPTRPSGMLQSAITLPAA